MSAYGHRDRPAYQMQIPGFTHPEYCENPHILRWWTPAHDVVIAKQIEEHQWDWYWGITDKLVAITPPDIIMAWRERDPLCAQWAWYNILMNFAASRAVKLHITGSVRKPIWKECPLCNNKFVEDSLPSPFIKRLGVNQLDFCAPCLSSILFKDTGSDSLTKEDIIKFLKDLSNEIQRVPSQDFGDGMYDIAGMTTAERLTLLQILKKKPTLNL